MKNLPWLALGIMLATQVAHATPMPVNSIHARSLATRDSNGHFWGTDNTNGKEGQQVVRYPTNGTPVPYSGSWIPDLKPKGSTIPHGNKPGGFVEHIWPLPDGTVLFDTQVFTGDDGLNGYNYLYKLNPATNTVGNLPGSNNKEAVMNLGQIAPTSPQRLNVGILHDRSLLVAKINNATVLFYGEYNFDAANSAVILWKSTDLGYTWSKVVAWNTVGTQTDHIHSLAQNPYNGWIYMTFGDEDARSAIVAWDGVSILKDNTALADIAKGTIPGWKAIAGTQRARAADLLFTPPPNGKCVWIPDRDFLAPGETLFGQRANYDLTGLEATGAVPYVNHVPAVLAHRDPEQGVLYWSSFQDTQAAPSEQNKIHLWSSDDAGLTWRLSAKVNTYNNWASVPQNLFTTPGPNSRLYLSGRGLEFQPPPNNNSAGSAVDFIPLKAKVSNTAPVANPDTYAVNRGQAAILKVLANDTDAQNNIAPNTVAVVNQPTRGTVAVSVNGDITYTSTPTNPGGADSFTYAVKDTWGLISNNATVSVYVRAANDDSASTEKNKAVTVNVLANDFFANAGSLTVSVAPPLKGKAVRNADNTITYTPAIDFIGTDSFTYTVQPASGAPLTATVKITVLDKPTITVMPDTYTVTTTGEWGELFDFPAAKGVGANDLPVIGTPGRSFKVVSPIQKISGYGIANQRLETKLFFRDTGGFYITLHATADSPYHRKMLKRGSYQFKYVMSLNGVISQPVTATIVVQ
jgi:Bacterial Ig domain